MNLGNKTKEKMIKVSARPRKLLPKMAPAVPLTPRPALKKIMKAQPAKTKMAPQVLPKQPNYLPPQLQTEQKLKGIKKPLDRTVAPLKAPNMLPKQFKKIRGATRYA